MQQKSRKERTENLEETRQKEYIFKMIDFDSNRTAIMLDKTNASTVRKMRSNGIKKKSTVQL